MKILNVDQYTSARRQISFAGQTYAVEEPTLQEFIDNLKAAEDLEKSEKKEESLADSFEQAIKSIKQSIPSLPEEKIRGLKVSAITAILQFIRGELDPEESQATESGAEKK
jgi:hypothetical protein